MDKVLIVIPARGGSVGVPRKNLRVVGSEPLVARKILQLQQVRFGTSPFDLVVSTDDETIAAVARMTGAEVHVRPTVDGAQTVAEAALACARERGHEGPVLIAQPTSPLAGPGEAERTLDAARRSHSSSPIALTVTDYRHLLHVPIDADRTVQVPQLRANRQGMAQVARVETGAYFAARTVEALADWVSGATIQPTLVPVSTHSALDVDSHDDLRAVRAQVHRADVTLVALAQSGMGSGHVSRCLTLADELAHHHIQIHLVGDLATSWAPQVQASGYPVTVRPRLVDIIPTPIPPADVVIFDTLDLLPPSAVTALADDTHVIMMECSDQRLTNLADLVVNELYDGPGACGPGYAVVRPEFLAARRYRSIEGPEANRALVAFGGMDPAGLNRRVAALLMEKTELDVWVASPDEPADRWINWCGPDAVIAEEMARSAVLVTSCGRTVNEAAVVGVPTVAVAANSRELQHVHAPGPIYMGHHHLVADKDIKDAVLALHHHQDFAAERAAMAMAATDGLGGRRIAAMVDSLVEWGG